MIRMRISMHPSAIRSKGRALSSPKGRWAKAQQRKIRPFQSAVQHSKSAELAFGHRTLFHVRVPFGLLFQGFLTGPCTQTCFYPPSMIFHLFSGYFRLVKKNYLVDKYPKTNLYKVQIIHNFIVIQSSILFLCMQSYFKH